MTKRESEKGIPFQSLIWSISQMGRVREEGEEKEEILEEHLPGDVDEMFVSFLSLCFDCNSRPDVSFEGSNNVFGISCHSLGSDQHPL